MLTHVINGIDINGENNTRQKFLSSVATFKVDKRPHTKDFKFQHHHVAELHGDRYLVCVKDPESGAAMLYEDSYTKSNLIIITDVHPLKYSAMRAEALDQVADYLTRSIQKELKKADKKKAGKAKA